MPPPQTKLEGPAPFPAIRPDSPHLFVEPTQEEAEALTRRYAAALAVIKHRCRHEINFAEAKDRVPTPAQRHDRQAIERRVSKPFADAVIARLEERQRQDNIAKARITLLSKLKK